ncbi:MAG: N-acetylmuramoyl-L-alanine amidase-like domain-containing protein [Pseudomonadota bacterium]
MPEVSALLRLAARARSLPGRLTRLSGALLGRPYLTGPLPGPDGPELLVRRLDAFDCVTFVESVLALGWGRTPEDYPRHLQALRYQNGARSWLTRRHYTSAWLAENVTEGRFTLLLRERWRALGPPRTLDLLAGYPALTWEPVALPVAELPALTRAARAGDFVGFISDRPNLDTFHVGLLVPGRPLLVRHASRSEGRVVEQPIPEFITRWEVSALLVARPLPLPGVSP